MPKKEYPPASRRSHRLTAEPIEQLEQLTDPEGSQKESTLNTDQTVKQAASTNDTDLAVPSIEVTEENSDEFESARESEQPTTDPNDPIDEMADNQNLADEIAGLRAKIAQLQAAANDPAMTAPDSIRGRTPTPAQSAFGGKAFIPMGIAAKEAFEPYGSDQKAANPSYDKKSKSTGLDPGKFTGDKEDFDNWITKLADKFTEDNETFKTERSRMMVIYSLTEKDAKFALS